MNDVIDSLNERDDVAKTEYTQRDADNGRVTVELWHDTEALQALFEKSMTGLHSEKSLQESAKESAFVVRETHVENVPIRALYPDIVERLKEESDKNEDYEYSRPE